MGEKKRVIGFEKGGKGVKQNTRKTHSNTAHRLSYKKQQSWSNLASYTLPRVFSRFFRVSAEICALTTDVGVISPSSCGHQISCDSIGDKWPPPIFLFSSIWSKPASSPRETSWFSQCDAKPGLWYVRGCYQSENYQNDSPTHQIADNDSELPWQTGGPPVQIGFPSVWTGLSLLSSS